MATTTVTIDNSRPEAKALIEYLRSLDYVEITSDLIAEEEDLYSIQYSIEEIDKRLDQVLVEMEEGKGIPHDQVFKEIMATFKDKR